MLRLLILFFTTALLFANAQNNPLSETPDHVIPYKNKHCVDNTSVVYNANGYVSIEGTLAACLQNVADGTMFPGILPIIILYRYD